MCVFVSSLALNSTQTSEARPVGCRTEKMDWNPSQSGSRSAWSLMSCFVTVFVLYSVLLPKITPLSFYLPLIHPSVSLGRV